MRSLTAIGRVVAHRAALRNEEVFSLSRSRPPPPCQPPQSWIDYAAARALAGARLTRAKRLAARYGHSYNGAVDEAADAVYHLRETARPPGFNRAVWRSYLRTFT